MAAGAKPFPAAPDSNLPAVLKVLHLQRTFTRFAIDNQLLAVDPAPAPSLYAAFRNFVTVNQSDNATAGRRSHGQALERLHSVGIWAARMTWRLQQPRRAAGDPATSCHRAWRAPPARAAKSTRAEPFFPSISWWNRSKQVPREYLRSSLY
jgi:hypothetical protein